MNYFWGLKGKELLEKLHHDLSESSQIYNDTSVRIKSEMQIREHILICNILGINKGVDIEKWYKANIEDDEKFLNSTSMLNKISRVSYGKLYKSLLYNFVGEKDKYMEILKEVEFPIINLEEEDKYKNMMTNRCYRNLSPDSVRLHILIVLRKFEGIHAFITKDKNGLVNSDNPSFKLEETNFRQYVYSYISGLLWEKRIGLKVDEITIFTIKMYYALYLYLTENEDKEEYKKIVLNYTQKIIINKEFNIYSNYAYILDLTINFPEVFGDILEKPHKIVKVDETLLDFNKPKPITPLSDNEKELIKNIKKDDLRLMRNKPKSLKKVDSFIQELVITLHNAKEEIKNLDNKIEKTSDYYEIVEIYSQGLDSIKECIYANYELNFDEQVVYYFELYNEYYNKIKNVILSVGEGEDDFPKYLILGYKAFELALIYSLLNKYDESLLYFEESTMYLKGEINANYYMEPRDTDGCAASFLKNAYAHMRLERYENMNVALYINPELDNCEEDEIGNMELTEPEVLVVHENIKFKELMKSVKDMIKIEEVLVGNVDTSKKLYEIINKKSTIDKAKDKDKANIFIDKKVQLLYNSIYSFNSYLEIIPFYEDMLSK